MRRNPDTFPEPLGENKPEEDTEINEENLAEHVMRKAKEIKEKYGEKVIKACQAGSYGLEVASVATAIGTNVAILKRFADHIVAELNGEIFSAGPSPEARVAIVLAAITSLATSTTIGPVLIRYFNKKRRQLNSSVRLVSTRQGLSPQGNSNE